jgi:hypothetical protein
VLGRGGKDPQTRVVEYPRGSRVAARRDIGAGLLVQPPAGQTELGGDRLRLLKDDAVRFEEGIDVAGGSARVIRESHGGASEHVEVCDHAAAGQPVAKAAEGLLDACAVEQRRGIAHAASIS